MSEQTVDEKTTRVHSSGGRAQRSLESLQCAFGYRVVEGPDKQPSRIRIRGMEETFWRHSSGSGRGAMYEQEEPRHISEIELPGDGPAARVWRELQQKNRKD